MVDLYQFFINIFILIKLYQFSTDSFKILSLAKLFGKFDSK